MAKQSFINRFLEWQNYVHYILNGIFLVIEASLIGQVLTTFDMLLITIGLIFVNDTIIHGIFWYLPKKYGQWRD